MSSIVIKGARENNLKDIDLEIPRNKLICFIGVSGSGKSTIAFDIIAREGQRQYFESLSSFARRYLQKSNKPDVDLLKGISSTIIISQDRVRSSPRSTVGTLTECYTYLRMLYSRVGLPSMDSTYFSFNHPHGACKKCKGLGRSLEVDVSKVIDFDKTLNEGAIKVSDWKVGGRMWSILKATYYFDMGKKLDGFTDEELNKLLYSKPELWVDDQNFVGNKWTFQGVVNRIHQRNSNANRDISEGDLKYFKFIDCNECSGWRLSEKALSVLINNKNIGEVANMSLDEAFNFVKEIDHPHAAVITPRLTEQLQNLINVGVGYLSLNRSTDTLSGGEAQRVKLARQLSSELIEMIYVLDEPTAGLHPRDVEIVVQNLKKLRDQGNTVIVVEHDETVIRNADHIIEVGPKGGKNGGEIVFNGVFEDILITPNSLTAKFLNSPSSKESKIIRSPKGYLKVKNANKHNLKSINVDIPLGLMTVLTGVSGAGKSSLVDVILEQSNQVILVDQSQIGGSKRSCIATYTGIFDEIRSTFAKNSGMSQSLFSFNSKGACDNCQGIGFIDMDMNFLGDVKIKCESCNGKRYKEKVLRYKYNSKDISEILNMTASEIIDFFDNKNIKDKMQLLIDVGLDYLEIGQTLDTLSGGESQRLKLASRLQNKGEFYILDEPTSGLHFADIEKLLKLLNKLVDTGNTVLLIEHNLDVIRNADWIIDIGPEGGDKGGNLVAVGTLEDIKKVENSITARFL